MQEVEGYLSIYAVMERFGYRHTSRAWKKLLFEHHKTLPEVKLRQFDGHDGRKGKFIPAIHVKDLDRLILHFESIHWQQDQVTFVRPAVEDVLQVVAVAFQDHGPEAQTEVDGVKLDLQLRNVRLALLYQPANLPDGRLPVLTSPDVLLDGGVRVLSFDPYQDGFTVGQLIFNIRQHVEGKKA
ncbi:hypothetical protein DC3_57330 [Deinococcus cellulosilyticus NBRC 106333 = KACC 11606]|uniref:Uncharacterized protein n=1 Tax=Deinococcus cellulosilyticus (strain DSM 18568 / NBRC 106333 / KACC 11606 / 5516J-15) TaxID=1223518 RepID=A0A511NC68_DEIC1|nr:hypothetical protein DC3_57330 [Deinococcus cellulosilyticus NBRC 106333 = KACC 11606]